MGLEAYELARGTAISGHIHHRTHEFAHINGPMPAFNFCPGQVLRLGSLNPAAGLCHERRPHHQQVTNTQGKHEWQENPQPLLHRDVQHRRLIMHKPNPADNREEGNVPSDLKGCFMISGGPLTSEPKCGQKLATREVNMAASQANAAPVYLKWSKTAITFNRANHSNHILQPGWFALVVSPIVSKTCLTKVRMDGRGGLNHLYTRMYDSMGLSRAAIQPSDAPFYGVVPIIQAVPLGQVDLPVTSTSRTTFQMEIITFEIINLPGAYHAI